MKKIDMIENILKFGKPELLEQFPWCESLNVINRYYSKTQIKIIYLDNYIDLLSGEF